MSNETTTDIVMATKTKFKIAAVQDTPVYLDKNATIEKACELIQEAASNGAKLVVFPEGFISGYPDWVWVLPPGHNREGGQSCRCLCLYRGKREKFRSKQLEPLQYKSVFWTGWSLAWQASQTDPNRR